MGEWAGQPNKFIEKIWSGLENVDMFGSPELSNYAYAYRFKLGRFPDWYLHGRKNEFKPKLHTVRAGTRWKSGMDIHFAINPRSKNYFQFAPVIPCVSVQEIEIIEMVMTSSSHCYQTQDGRVWVIVVDGVHLKRTQIEQLAINDGFDSVEQFFSWFNKDFKGQMIHWSDLRY